MAEPQSWQGMMEWCARLLEERTGAGVQEWNRRIREAEVVDQASLRSWLTERGVTGYAQMLLVMERFGYPDFLLASAEELIDGQYADRPQLRPILDRLLAVASIVGDVTVQARKGYVSLMTPRRKFATVKATTRRRVDLGLRLDGETPTGRLEEAKLRGADTINCRIALHAPEDVDDEVVQWLQRSYTTNA